jgi:hypothetical protein
MEVADLSFTRKEYESRTLGLVVKGSLYDTIPEQRNEAVYQIVSKAPRNCVVITSTVKTDVHFVIEEPHPDCKACHCEQQPVWYTSITARAFPDVFPEHWDKVRLFGEKNRVVVVPVMKENFFDYIRRVERDW